jgi:ATP-binding cassette subfamily B protein/subfamily B ATP-binding cassette protein MsbA
MRAWPIRLLKHASPPVRPLATVVALVLLGSGLDALRPWPLKLLVDGVLLPDPAVREGPGWLKALPGATSNTVLVAWLAAAGLLLVSASQLVRAGQSYVQTGLGSRLAYGLGATLLARLQALSLVFHGRQRIGDLVRRVVTDSACIRDLVLGVMIPAGTAATQLVVMFLVMFRLDALLSLVAMAFAAPLVILIRSCSEPMARREHEHQRLEGQLFSLAEESLVALPVIQTFTAEPRHDRQWRDLADQTLRASLRTLTSQLQFKIVTGGVTAVGTATVMIVGGMHVLDGTLTIGSLLVFLMYLGSVYAPLETVAYLATSYAAAAAGAGRVLEVLDSDDRVADQPLAKPLVVSGGTRGVPVRFDRVTFGYRRPDTVLREIDLEIHAGQVVAVVGPTGAGKSTLASLVPRLFDPWSGRVCVDRHDVRDVTLSSLRGQVAIVPQEPLLLPLSLAENIAYGRPGASMAEVEAAGEAGGVAEFIPRMPQGYATVIGEGGRTLSAGQRQRVAIARALLKDSPVLILDEPTSALDAATESAVVEATSRLMAGRTCLIIAHRLSTIRHADRIVVLDRGRIVQYGSHAELTAAPGIYQHFCELQTLQPAGAAG